MAFISPALSVDTKNITGNNEDVWVLFSEFVYFDYTQALSFDWWLKHLAAAYQTNPLHMVTELTLIIIILYVLFKKSRRPTDSDKLSESERNELIRDWKPEPLISNKLMKFNWDKNEIIYVKTIKNNGKIIDIKNKEYIQFSSHNYLNFSNNDEVKLNAKNIIKKYSVGSCGPRGFYGTMDVHLMLEIHLAQYFGCNDGIIYADYIGCITSIVTAFAKRGDLLLIDDACHYLILQSAVLSRSNVIWYPHNDMKQLESYLQTMQEEEIKRNPRDLIRKFIITEGLFYNFGDICNLKEIVRLKNEYKYRLIIDDTHAIGTIHPKGTPGYFNVDMKEIDMYCGGMDGALGSVGGFCVGSKEVINHQTLSAAGYVFSASGPPFQCIAVSVGLGLLVKNGIELCNKLKENSQYMRSLLIDNDKRWYIIGNKLNDICSPIIHIRMDMDYNNKFNINDTIVYNMFKKISKYCQNKGILIYPNAYLPQEYNVHNKPNPKPSLKIVININHTKKDLQYGSLIIKKGLQLYINMYHTCVLLNEKFENKTNIAYDIITFIWNTKPLPSMNDFNKKI